MTIPHGLGVTVGGFNLERTMGVTPPGQMRKQAHRRVAPLPMTGNAWVNGPANIHRGDQFEVRNGYTTVKGTVARRYTLRDGTIKLWLAGVQTVASL